MAKLPATAVTTKMAHASRPMSMILPADVSGFFRRRRDGEQLHGGEEGGVADAVDVAALLAAFDRPDQDGADGEDDDRQGEREHQTGEQPSVPFLTLEESRQFLPYHSHPLVAKSASRYDT